MKTSNIATNAMIITAVVCILLIIAGMVLSSTIALAFGLLGLLVPMYIAEVYIDDICIEDCTTEADKTNEATRLKQVSNISNMNDADKIEIGFSILSIVFIIGILIYWFI